MLKQVEQCWIQFCVFWYIVFELLKIRLYALQFHDAESFVSYCITFTYARYDVCVVYCIVRQQAKVKGVKSQLPLAGVGFN